MTNMEEIQSEDAARVVERHYSEHWTNPMTPEEICREQNKRMPRGVRETKFGTQDIDAVLMRAPQPNARKLYRGRNNLPVHVIAMGLCVTGLLAVAVLS